MKRQLPPLPEGWLPEHTPIITFISASVRFDIDGRVFELNVVGGNSEIKNVFSGKLVWSGKSPDGPFALDAAMFVMDKIERRDGI